jgi:hypothetical protein
MRADKTTSTSESPYIAPKDLAMRWCCGRSSVDRIARRAGLTRVCLGEGPNGMVRYIRKEVEAFELNRQVKSASGYRG